MTTTNAQAATKLKPTKKTITVGKTAKISISGKNKSVKWSVSNKNIKITKKTKKYVKINGVKAGKSVLKAKVGKKTYKCNITVKAKKTADNPVTPTQKPATATETPVVKPTAAPTIDATKIPVATENPTTEPINSVKPTVEPTVKPTEKPTVEPTVKPTKKPTVEPTVKPTEKPIEEVKPTEKPIETPIPTKEPLKTLQENIEILREYTLPDSIGLYTRRFLVVKNNSDVTVDITTSSIAYGEDDKIVSSDDAYLYALGAGCTSIFYEAFETDKAIKRYTTDMNVEPSEYYTSVIQDLSYVQNDIDNGAVIQVTNNGTDVAEFVEGYALFFKDDELIGYDDHYFTDNDFEIKPGATITKQFTEYDEFDRIEFYLTGRRYIEIY